MANRSGDPTDYLTRLASRIGAERAVLASYDGLLVAGAGGNKDELDELAAYAPSGLPAKIARPSGMSVKRIEIYGERFYLASLGAETPNEATSDLAQMLGG